MVYVEDLFGTVPRTNNWQLAEIRGGANPYGFQHLLERAAWVPNAVRDALQAYRVMPLLLCMCLGWLWGAVPVAAQDEAPSSTVEVSGPYHNLTEHHAGTFHLKREGDAVYATFRTDRSPVQHFARQQPQALFTVPEGFRPPVAITWEVSAQPVQTDGTPHPTRPDHRMFRMHVDPEGQVRYVDDPGVDGVGYLRYQTALAWPLAGSDPRICKRHRKIREGILAAVQALEDATLPCSQVDWSHLARIQTLSLSLPVPLDADAERHVLLGLTNLATLQLQSWSARGPVAEDTHLTKLLAPTPRLQTLRIEGGDLNVSADLLRYTPHLEALHLELRQPTAELVQLLAHVPHLTHLTVAPSTPLPATFLTAVPQLTHLTVKDGLTPCASPNLLAAVPRLTRFAVRMDADTEALACLGSALHRLASDLTELEIELLNLQDLNVEILPNLPQLTHLTLDVTGMVALPEHLLAQVPALTHLTLQGQKNANLPAVTLPAGFLAHTPRLTDLTLKAYRLAGLSPDLLVPVPGLRQLQIDTLSLVSPPAGFLDPVPQLTELRIKVGARTHLPADFLTQAPHLEVLYLNVQSLESLPANFLTYAPRLVDLYLRMPLLQALPPTFLIHAPRLETLELEAGHGIVGGTPKCNQNPPGPRQFPEHFLSHAPRLVELYLRVPMLQALPPSFLGHAPLLETMEVEYTYGGYCFSYEHNDLRKVIMPLRSFPANFLTHTPNLRFLNLQTGHVAEFPPDFLSHAPLLRHLNLDANGISALPANFLTRHPRLETVQLLANGIPSLPRGFLSQSPNLVSLTLDLRQVEALSEGFLANTPRLHEVKIDVHRAKTLPPGFLAEAPQLVHLNLRALNLTAWPADFLAHASRLQTLGLAMPLLEPTLTPDHRLWEVLQETSLRVKVTQPDPVGEPAPYCPANFKLGTILEVWERAPDDHGRLLLLVSPWQEREFFARWGRTPYWRERGLFVTYWEYHCLYLLDARFTTPTLEVCEAFREPEECEPIRNRYITLPEEVSFSG